jgi:hemerythrin-like domain-containing protein
MGGGAEHCRSPMMATPHRQQDGSPSAIAYTGEALAVFEASHVGILEKLERLRALPGQFAELGAAPAVCEAAARLHRFFNDAVLQHHDEEEHELFPALRHSAQAGDEAGLVDAITGRLQNEHRQLEEMWDRIEPVLRRLGRAKPVALDAAFIERFATAYAEHARFEEAAVLPLAERILKAGDRSALALALAMRRRPMRLYGYI